MRKVIMLSIVVFAFISCMNKEKPSPSLQTPVIFEDSLFLGIDSLYTTDIQKHMYLLSWDVLEYSTECYNDSIPVSEFDGKPTNGYWFLTKGRYYVDVFNFNVEGRQYVHRIPTWDGFIEFLSLKYEN